MKLATLTLLTALTFIAATLINRPIHVEPLHLTPPPPARNNITFHPHFYIASEAIKHPVDKDLVFPKLHPFTDSGITISIEGAEHPTVLWHSNILAWVDNVGDADIHVVMSRLRHGDFSLKGIVEHEIAHSLGLDHSDHAGNLMSNNYEDQVMCIDDQTLKRLFRLRHWRLDYYNPAC